MLSAYAKDIKYPVSAIPEALKKNANVVVREDETVFQIISRNKSSVHRHFAATILNTNGRDYAEKYIMYDKKRKIVDLKAFVYDASGEIIKKLKSADIADRSASDGFSLFSDDRLKMFDLTQGVYPYTVEYEYEVQYDYLYSIDPGVIVSEEKIAVQHFMYQLVYPTTLEPRYKTYNIDTKPAIGRLSSGMQSATWELSNIEPIKIEPMSSSSTHIKAIVAAPNVFEYDGYTGSMENWDGIAKWQQSLNQGRDVLPDVTRAKVKELTKDLKTTEEKVKVLYEYMQSKTRYVGIQLGIGGWQPFDATTVDKNGYGDCKALSNYMVSLLKEAGIKGYYTKIRAGVGEEEIDASFPSVQTNHIIVGVPNEKDTLWLECTSQTAPFGYLGRFTDNRYGLMVTENGGKLVRTIHYPVEKNIQSTTADVDLDALGNAKAKVKTNYSGLQYDFSSLSEIINLSADDQRKWLQNNTQIPSFNINQFAFANHKNKLPTATVTMDLTLNKYASVSNKRIFLTPNLMNRWTYIPEKIESRKTPFEINTGFTDIDTIRYHLPENIYPEFLPPDAKFTSRFGTYEAGFKVEAGSLLYIRKMTRKDGEFPAEAYQELIDFYKNISKADNTKLVFLSKT
jgi:transglutaminase-like putative cysteine protease